MKGLKRFLHLMFELTKWKLSFLVTLSGGTGFLMASQEISPKLFPILAGILLLASGASGLNQVQERKEDLLMERTKNRPIPSGRLSAISGLTIALGLLFSGALLLYRFTQWETFVLGILAVLLYNGIYTPLKKKTLFAIVPGALVGTIPPAMGWFGGGGRMDPQIIAYCSLFFLWQIPHSWLLLLDSRIDFSKAGFPSLVQTGGKGQVQRISWIWIMATVVCSLLIPLFGTGYSLLPLGGLLFLGFFLTLKVSTLLLLRSKTEALRSAFRTVNLYMLSVMMLLNLCPLFQHLSLSFLTG